MSDADDEPPLPSDHDIWRRIVEQGRLARFREGVIVGAIRANYRRAGVDQDFVREMVVYISDRMLAILRGEVSPTAFPDGGRDIVEAVHDAMLKALLSPTAADGEGLRKWFRATLRNRAIDHVRMALKAMKLMPDMVDDPGGMVDPRTENFSEAEQAADVQRILDKLRGKGVREAFELHMQGYGCSSTKGESISSNPGERAGENVLGFFERASGIVHVTRGQAKEDEVVVIAHELGHFRLHADPESDVTDVSMLLSGEPVESGAARVDGYLLRVDSLMSAVEGADAKMHDLSSGMGTRRSATHGGRQMIGGGPR